MSRTMKTIEAGASEDGMASAGGADGRARARPGLEPRIQSALGRELRAMYDEVVSAPVPDRFMKLLEQLEQTEEAEPARTK